MALGCKIQLFINEEINDLLKEKAETMMISRSAVARLAIKQFTKVEVEADGSS